MAGLKPSRYDSMLIHLALLAPLAMLLLGKWQASLERWYIEPELAPVSGFAESFPDKLDTWLSLVGIDGNKLILIVDQDCPCTRATLSKLESALKELEQPPAILEVINIQDPRVKAAEFIKDIPSTPTLLTIKESTLTYAGPVNAGNFCTTAINAVLGLTALKWETAAPVYNWLERGCYCSSPMT